jgi:hypothetical protein
MTMTSTADHIPNVAELLGRMLQRVAQTRGRVKSRIIARKKLLTAGPRIA